jgi:hypothetical protein
VPARRPVRHGEEIPLLGIVEFAFGANAQIADIFAGAGAGHGLFERDGLGLHARFDLRDEGLFPLKALQLPQPKPDRYGKHRGREHRKQKETAHLHGLLTPRRAGLLAPCSCIAAR